MNSSKLRIWRCQNLQFVPATLRAGGVSRYQSGRVLACSLLLSAPLMAAETLAAVQLDTQVVSATGHAVAIDDSVIKTEVISADQLKLMQAKVLTDALRHAPGLKIQRTVKNGSKLNIQGADANHVLILKDGLPFISPTSSETDISQIPLTGIARIEIIKGAGSALYGSSAMGGVINLISKEIAGNSAEIDVSHSRYQDHSDGNLNEASLFASGKQRQTKISTQLFVKEAPQIDLDSATSSADGARQNLHSAELRLDQGFDRVDAFIRLNYLTDKKEKSLTELTFPGQGNYDADYESDTRKKSIDGGVQGFSSRFFDNGSITFRYEDYKETSGNTNGLSGRLKQRDADRSLLKIESRFSRYFSTFSQQISYGMSYQTESMDQVKKENAVVEVDDERNKSIEAYLQDNIALTHNQDVIVGIRSQRDSEFGFHHSAKANWMMSLDRWKLRVSYGKGYRTPNLKERFYLFDHSNLGYIIQGNTALKPETSDNVNATASYQFDHSVLDISLYHNAFRNKIDTSGNGVKDNIKQFKYKNIERAYTQGIDISHTLQSEKVYWQNSISVLDSKDKQSGLRLENRPRLTFKTQLNSQVTEAFSVSLFGQVEKNRFNGLYDSDDDGKGDSYIRSVTDIVQSWDIKFNYQFVDSMAVYGAIENILDETKSTRINQARENDERAIDPRLFRLGMNLKF